MEFLFNVRFVGNTTSFGASVYAEDADHARRVAELVFFDEYGFDLSLLRWVDVDVEEVA